MIFEEIPTTCYVSDGKGNVMKGLVTSCTISNSLYEEPSVMIECREITMMKKADIGNIDTDVFMELLKEG